VLSQQREAAFRGSMKTLSKVCQVLQFAQEQATVLCGKEGDCQLPRAPDYWEWQRIVREGNPEALLNLLTLFDLADEDRSASLSAKEVRGLASSLGFELSEQELEVFLWVFDPDGTGQIRFEDFSKTIMYGGFSGADSAETDKATLQRLFNWFDRDHDGSIDKAEMLEKLQVLGFDGAGVEQLFVNIAGAPQESISEREFAMYLQETQKDVFIRS